MNPGVTANYVFGIATEATGKFYAQEYDGTTNAFALAGTAAVADQTYFVAASYVSTTLRALVVDEVITADSVATTGLSSAIDKISIGRGLWDPTGDWPGYVGCAVVWARNPSAEEFREYRRNPWQIYAPQRRAMPRVATEAVAGAVTGTLAATEGADSASFIGTAVVLVTGTLAATEGADVAAFSGASYVFVAGTLAATEGADSAIFTGAEAFTGTLAATEGADTAAFSGVSTFGVDGTLAATEGADAAAFSWHGWCSAHYRHAGSDRRRGRRAICWQCRRGRHGNVGRDRGRRRGEFYRHWRDRHPVG